MLSRKRKGIIERAAQEAREGKRESGPRRTVHISSFEGESGLLLEQYVDDTITEVFPFYIKDSNQMNVQQ